MQNRILFCLKNNTNAMNFGIGISTIWKKADEAVVPLTEEEKTYAYYEDKDLNAGDMYMKMPEDIRELTIRRFYGYLKKLVVLGENYDSVFVMDVSDGYRGLNLLNADKIGWSLKTGEYYNSAKGGTA